MVVDESTPVIRPHVAAANAETNAAIRRPHRRSAVSREENTYLGGNLHRSRWSANRIPSHLVPNGRAYARLPATLRQAPPTGGAASWMPAVRQVGARRHLVSEAARPA